MEPVTNRFPLWGAFLEFVALVGFAVSPLFDLFGRYPELLVANGLDRFEIVLLAGVLGFALPVLFVAIEGALAWLAPGLDRGFHAAIIVAFVSIIALQLLSRSDEFATWLRLLASGAAGLAAAYAQARWQPAAGLLRFLSLGALVFPALFLFQSPAGELLRMSTPAIPTASDVERPTPIVLIVMDELPVISLLDGDGRINARRHPSFARLAEGSTWYPNTATVATFTTTAIPALLSGNTPNEYVMFTTFERFPENLYSLLDGHYRFHVFETVTQLCPQSVCGSPGRPGPIPKILMLLPDVYVLYLHLILPESLRRDLPDVEHNWKDFDAITTSGPESQGAEEPRTPTRQERIREHNRNLVERSKSVEEDFELFMQGIESDAPGEATLHYFHMILPHGPYRFLPSGRSYLPGPDFSFGLDGVWGGDDWEAIHAQQRHLLQLGFVDRLLGRLIDRLETIGLYDDALVVIIADHGVSFLPGAPRRHVSPENQGETLLVPFFLKRPGQTRGEVDERGVLTVDLVPTIAAAIGADIPWPVEGRSVLAPADEPRGDVEIVTPSSGESLRFPRADLAESRERLLRRQQEIFGRRPGFRGLYEIGFAPELIGLEAADLEVLKQPTQFSVHLFEPARYRNVDPHRPLPSLLAGTLQGRFVAKQNIPLAIAVNGRIEALSKTYTGPTGAVAFQAMIPERALVPGRNLIEVYRVQERDGSWVLRPSRRATR